MSGVPDGELCMRPAMSCGARGAAATTACTCSRAKKSSCASWWKKLPELRAKVPEQFVVDGYWDGEFLGRKTATRPNEYRSADFPAHFTRTRCVFGDSQGFCELEKFARNNGQHPWSYKPTTCWMFPLQDEDGAVAEPVRGQADDPYFTRDYPGYASCLPCGRHDPAGKPWRESLAREISYLEAAPRPPKLGTPGNTVDELLAAIQPGSKSC